MTKRLGLIFLFAPLVSAQYLTSAHTEYIRLGDRVVATVSTPAVVFSDPAFSGLYALYLDAADYMWKNGITIGCSVQSPQFCPDVPLNRTAMAVLRHPLVVGAHVG